MRTRHWLRFFLLCSAGALGLAWAPAALATFVYPGDPSWTADVRGSNGQVAITGANPRLGNGSLEASVGDLQDWAFFYHAVDDRTNQSWGKLSDIGQLSFDWYRSSATSVAGDAPWQAQTPVLRLLIRELDGGVPLFSEIVWEKYYTDSSATVNDTWFVQNLGGGQKFWRHVEGEGYDVIDPTENVSDIYQRTLLTGDTAFWGSLLGQDAEVYGIAVGVGSNWPAPYLGFIDNVKLGFGGRPPVVDANFELVPEPSTGLLVATGLAAAALAGRRRRSAA